MKPVRSVVRTTVLPKRAAERYRFVKHFRIRGNRANQFHHFHHRHGIEEMHADEAIGARRERGHLRDGKRGGVAGENRLLRTDLIERAVKLALCRKLLDDGLDDDVAVFEIIEIGRAAQAGARFVAVRRLQRALLHKPRQILVDRLQAFIQQLLRDFAHHHRRSPIAPPPAQFPIPSGRTPPLRLSRWAFLFLPVDRSEPKDGTTRATRQSWRSPARRRCRRWRGRSARCGAAIQATASGRGAHRWPPADVRARLRRRSRSLSRD